MNVMNVKGEYWIEARQCLNLMCHMLPACLRACCVLQLLVPLPAFHSKPARAGLIAMKAQFPSSNLQSPWNMQHYDRKEPKERERQLRVAGALNHTCVYVQSVYVFVCVLPGDWLQRARKRKRRQHRHSFECIAGRLQKRRACIYDYYDYYYYFYYYIIDAIYCCSVRCACLWPVELKDAGSAKVLPTFARRTV